MKYLIFNTLQAAQGRNNALNNQMRATIPNYNAIQWAMIVINNSNNKWAFSIKETDPRKPQNKITPPERNNLTDLDSTWYHTDSDGVQVLTYA